MMDTTMGKLRAAAISLRSVIPARGGPHFPLLADALDALADDAEMRPKDAARIAERARKDLAAGKAQAAREIATAKAAKEAAEEEAAKAQVKATKAIKALDDL